MSVGTVPERIAGNWQFSAVHSSVEFSVQYLVAKFRGSFGEVNATLVDGVLTGTAQVGSVSVKDPNLTGHLQSPDFFDAEQFPEITFTSEILGIDGDTLTLDGQLTLKGVTKPVHAVGTVAGPTDDFMGNTRLGFTVETTINRTDFGVNWNADLPTGGKALSDEVTLTAELEFHKA
ncbi:MAG: YceI family protein [Solirubrobacteraceae bacterium]